MRAEESREESDSSCMRNVCQDDKEAFCNFLTVKWKKLIGETLLLRQEDDYAGKTLKQRLSHERQRKGRVFTWNLATKS